MIKISHDLLSAMEKGTETESHQFELKNIGFISNHQNVEKVSLICVIFVVVFELGTSTEILLREENIGLLNLISSQSFKL